MERESPGAEQLEDRPVELHELDARGLDHEPGPPLGAHPGGSRLVAVPRARHAQVRVHRLPAGEVQQQVLAARLDARQHLAVDCAREADRCLWRRRARAERTEPTSGSRRSAARRITCPSGTGAERQLARAGREARRRQSSGCGGCEGGLAIDSLERERRGAAGLHRLGEG